MLAFQPISLVLLLTIVHICLSYPSMSIRERRSCRGCGTECDRCIYKTVLSEVCPGRVRECRKGPNESCGGSDNVRGVCGEGMQCQCGRCTGCSFDTMKCSEQKIDEPCRPGDEDMRNGYWDPLRVNRFIVD